jgi:hypothetical protein
VSNAALKIARAKEDGTFARMLVRTVERWIARVGTVSAQTRLVGMRGHDLHGPTNHIWDLLGVRGR